jgi:pimeloyl-ACP methyl ester carboxylesterase
MNSRLKILFGWTLEGLVLLLFPFYVILTLLNELFKFEKMNMQNTGKNIVIFEHWFSKNFWHIFMKFYLEKLGHRVYWTNYSLIKGGADEGAEYLENYIAKNDIKNATLVGISFGAITSYSYLQKFKGWKKIDKFISIAGPFKGTPLAIVLCLFKGGRQMLPNSKYLQDLLSVPRTNGSKIVSVSALRDEMVPKQSTRLDFARNITLNVIGHNVLHMFSRELFTTIAHEATS